jgi:hypothetical protein
MDKCEWCGEERELYFPGACRECLEREGFIDRMGYIKQGDEPVGWDRYSYTCRYRLPTCSIKPTCESCGNQMKCMGRNISPYYLP